jgi:hypothetical protein
MNEIHGLTPAFVCKVEKHILNMRQFYYKPFLDTIKKHGNPERFVESYVNSLVLDMFDREFLTGIVSTEQYAKYLGLYGEFIKANKAYLEAENEVILGLAGIKFNNKKES